MANKHGDDEKMSKEDLNLNHSSSFAQITRVKIRKREPRKTVGITLPLSLIEEARKRNLNISRICEQALLSILEYMEAQKIDASQKEALCSFGEAFLQRKGSVPRAGFEPATTRSSAGRSPRLSYLGRQFFVYLKFRRGLFVFL